MTRDLRPAWRPVAIGAGAAVCAWLVPWSARLAVTLPSTATAHHWNLAWTGLDLAEAAAAGATAWLLVRHDRRAALSAGALATLLCLDAWFDVCTAAPGQGRSIAVAEALLLELPLAWAAGRLATETLRRE